METRVKFLSGAVWSGVNAIASVLLPLFVFFYFARLTPPWQVGVIAYALAWVEVVKMFAPLGVYEALLPSEDYDSQAAAAGTLMAVCGVAAFVLYAGLIGLSTLWMPKIGELYWLALALGTRMIFDLLSIQPQIALARKLKFRGLASRSLFGNLAASLIGLAASFFVPPVAALTLYYVVQAMVGYLATVLSARHFPPLTLDWSPLRGVAKTAFMATQVRSLATIINYADQLIAGSFVAPAVIAWYNAGKRVEIAEFTASSSFSGVLFQPLFARAGDQDMSEKFQRCLLLITLFCGVPAVVLAINAKLVIGALLGPQWLGAAPLVSALAIAGLGRAIGGVHGAYMSVNGLNSVLRTRAITSALTGGCIVALTGVIGIVWVGVLLAVKNTLITAWSAWAVRRLAGPMAYLKSVFAVLGSALVGALLGRWLGVWLGGAWPAMPQLGVAVMSGLVAGLLVAVIMADTVIGLVRGRGFLPPGMSLAGSPAPSPKR